MNPPALDTAAKRPVELLWSRFVGDIGKTDRFLYDAKPMPGWSSEPLTERVLADHVFGLRRIGVGQIGSTLYGVIDLDGKSKGADGKYILAPARVEAAWANTRRVVELFERHGFKVLVEVSRSRGGWHVWVLCDPVDPPSVEEMRRLLKAVLRMAGLPDDGNEGDGHPGIFPNPPGPKECGRAPFLPWSGLLNGKAGAVFVDLTDGVPFERQESALEDADLVTRERIVAALTVIETPAVKLETGTMVPPANTSGVLTRPKDAARHDALRNYTMRWANMGMGEVEVRTFGYHLAENWGMLAENRGGEVENLVVGAMLKAKRESDATPDLPHPADLYSESFTARRPAFDNTIMRRSGITLVWSAPGGLKTHTTMVLVHEMLCDTGTGHLFQHPGLWINRRWRRVLWIATEECGDELRFQAEQVLKGLGKDRLDGELHYVFAAEAGNRLSLDDLPELIERYGPWDAIVLDSLTGLRPKVVNGERVRWDVDNDAANEACLKLRGLAAKHQVCFLIVHHSGRDTTRYRGATDWWASADSMIGLTPDGGRVKFDVEKVRGGKKPAPFTLEPEWAADGSFSLTYAGTAAPAKLSASGKAMLIFLQAKGTASQTEMIKAAGCATSTGKASMKALIEAGYAVDTGELRGKSPVYRLHDPAESEVSDDTTGHLDGEDDSGNAPF